MRDAKNVPSSVNEYIRFAPKQARPKLRELRAMVRRIAPEAEETISYRMPAYILKRNLVYFAGFERHIGFYPGAKTIAAFRRKLSKYKNAKGSVQFPLEKPLPKQLIRSMLEHKILEIRTGK